MTTEYVHSALKPGRCRVFKLLPGDFDDDIHIRLKVIKLKTRKQQSYEALSYVWGSTEDPEKVWVISEDSHQGDSKRVLSYIHVTQNLAEALRYIRQSTTAKLLWADAICIYQENIPERSAQVQQMPLIYYSAAHVWVWLGPAADDSDWAMDTLQSWGSISEFDEENYRPLVKMQYATEHPWIEDRTYVIAPKSRAFISCRAILEREWFERLWVKPEIYLSANKATVLCGHRQISWQDFSRGMLAYVWRGVESGIPDADRFRECVARFCTLLSNSIFSFEKLLKLARASKCSDPRDKIWATLGMLGKNDGWLEDSLKPDYSMNVTELYNLVVEVMIKEKRSLGILRYCITSPASKSPRWVPNWADSTSEAPPANQDADLGVWPAPSSFSGDLLEVRGVRAAMITDVEPVQFSFDMDIDDLATEIKRLLAKFSKVCSDEVDEDLLETMAYTVGELQVSEHEVFVPARPSSASIAVYKRVLRYIIHRPSRASTATTGEHENSVELLDFTSELVQKYRGRSLARTDGGHLLLAPAHTQVGDIVAVLLGLSTAMILHPQPDTKSQVVGVCFVHGLNFGEALVGPLHQDWQFMKRIYSDHWEVIFRNQQTGTITVFDQRINWDRLKVSENDPMRDSYLSEQGQGHFKQVDEQYLIDHGVKVETFQLV